MSASRAVEMGILTIRQLIHVLTEDGARKAVGNANEQSKKISHSVLLKRSISDCADLAATRICQDKQHLSVVERLQMACRLLNMTCVRDEGVCSSAKVCL